MIGIKTKNRFEEKFILKGSDDCWQWTAWVCKQGYGRFKLFGNMQLAHRVAYRLYKEEFPEPLKVLHTCDNPGCVNPAHLFLGTDLSNSQDKIAKGRANISKGEDCYQAKLTMHQIRRMREFSLTGTRNFELVKLFKVSKLVVSRIVNHKIYKEDITEKS